MSHFSIGYQPEEDNGNVFTVAFTQHSEASLTTKQPGEIKSLIKTYLSLIGWVAAVPASGVMK